jgi:hypothetical protein
MSTIGRVGDQLIISAEQARAFLASPAGARLRRVLATGVILSAPLLFRTPMLRRHPMLRAIEALGGVALVVKAAEALRDWDAGGGRTERIVIDVPPAR